MRVSPILFGTTFLLATGTLAAQTPPRAPQDCSSSDHRAFDFWLGEWEVTANGSLAGQNLITSTQGGCILHEHWTGTGGSTGESFNFYDRSTGKWNQLWIDAQGNVLRLEGGFEEGSLRLAGTTRGRNGGSTLQRLAFIPRSDGSVRQLWESSTDGGVTWVVVFDGRYVRKP